MLLEGPFLLFYDAISLVPHFLLFPLMFLSHPIYDSIMTFGQRAVLHFPLLFLSSEVLLELLIPLNFDLHLLLERLLQLLRLLCVEFLKSLDSLFIFHLHVTLLLPQHFVLPALGLYLLTILLLQLGHLLLMIAIPVSQLEVDSVRKLLHLALELKKTSLLVIEKDTSDKDLIGKTKTGILLTLGRKSPLDIPYVQATIIADTEQILFILCESDAGHCGRVGLIFRKVSIQGKVVASQRARTLKLRHSSKHHL
mmetsp:Transcript_41346/g.95159  ORF Transcript_41346/g.95159 Transcript_41346/m.95159 type:complete len:253 (-) Transcript_41346:1782-2540(-)